MNRLVESIIMISESHKIQNQNSRVASSAGHVKRRKLSGQSLAFAGKTRDLHKIPAKIGLAARQQPCDCVEKLKY
jgi:hypothetical protein